MYYGEFTYFCSISDGDLYTGTVADFSGMDPIIYREPLQTEQYDSMSLNGESSTVYLMLCFIDLRRQRWQQREEGLHCQRQLWKVSLIMALGSMLTVRFFWQKETVLAVSFNLIFTFVPYDSPSLITFYHCELTTEINIWPNQLSAFFFTSERRTTRKSWCIGQVAQ